jgi:hypothetical protein
METAEKPLGLFCERRKSSKPLLLDKLISVMFGICEARFFVKEYLIYKETALLLDAFVLPAF